MQTRSKTAAENKKGEQQTFSDVQPSEMMQKFKRQMEAKKQRMVSDVKPSERMQRYQAQQLQKRTSSTSTNASSSNSSH